MDPAPASPPLPPPAPEGSPELPLRLMLRFTPADFERRFVRHYVATYQRLAQAALALGVLLIAGDFLVDYLAWPGNEANWLRLQVAIPIIAGALAYTFLPQARRHWQPFVSGFVVVIGCGLFWVLLRIDADGGPGITSWVGILNFTFIQFYCFVVLGVQFRFALISGLLILAAFVLALWTQPAAPSADPAYWSYHVLTLFTLPMGIGWWREYLLRREFATRTALDEAREQAVRLARTKSEFLATMSHEMRTPMNAVIGLTHLLHRDTQDPAQAARIARVGDAAQHLLHIINNVLDMSRIESGNLSLETIDFDLDALLARCCDLVEGTARAKGVALLRDTPGLPQRLRGDPTRLSQALLNLLGNAVKFTERGTVTLSCRVLAANEPETRLLFEVHDTGIGISPERMAHIFEAFEQGDSSTTRRYGGSGLGLSITRHLARLMGGEVGVSSELGQGSTFWLTVALQAAQPGSVRTADPEAQRRLEAQLRTHHGGARVLLVEDDLVNQEVATVLLGNVGLAVDVAHDGAQAVEMAGQGDYALILMDMQMPVMDGLQASRALRVLPSLHQVPIIAMTANAFSEDRAACLAAGMNDHVSKPVEPQVLYEVLLRWLPPRGPVPGA